MNTLNNIKNRIQTEVNKAYQNPFINNKGEGVPIEITTTISINEMIELSNSNLILSQQKQQLKKKIQTYYKGVEMFGEKRVFPQINQYGNITIWID